jgi:predicted O-methyltransferase YrrM
MNVKQKLFSEKSARDEVFNDALALLSNKPAKILEIGCLRDLNSRAGDGWSTLHWANYVEKNGGRLVFCDINAESVDLCLDLIRNNFSEIEHVGKAIDGIGWISDHFNFIYLDGSDNPTETLNQFEKCKTDSQIVLIDDFHTKGVLVDQKYPEKFLFRFSNGHNMALYGKGVKTGEKLIKV